MAQHAPNLVCGVDVSRFAKHVQFSVLSASVLVLFLLYGFAQEKIFHIPGFRSHGWFLSFIQFLIVMCISYVDATYISKSTKRREQSMVPYYDFMILAWLTVGTMGLSTVALGYLNFPTQVIFKSCKLIPVMIGGIIIQGKRYKLHDYASVLLMCFGLVWFSLADQTVSPEFEPRGILLICMALSVDAVFGNFQEKLMKKHPYYSNADIVFYSYSFGCVLIFTWLVATGEMLPSLLFTLKNPEVYPLAGVYSIFGYLGVQCVLALIKSSGVLVATIVTTSRKVLTVVFSFVFFTKPFTFQYVWSGSLVFAGISISIFTRNRIPILNGISSGIRALQRFLGSHYDPISQQDQMVQQV